MYQIELVWNREFNFVPYGKPRESLDETISYLRVLEDMGDGARIKKSRILNEDGEVVYADGRKVTRHDP